MVVYCQDSECSMLSGQKVHNIKSCKSQDKQEVILNPFIFLILLNQIVFL